MWSLTVKASAPHWIEWLPHNAPLSPKLWCRHSGKSKGWEPRILISSVSFNHRPFAYLKPQDNGSTSQIKCIKQKVQRKTILKEQTPCVSPSHCKERWPISDTGSEVHGLCSLWWEPLADASGCMLFRNGERSVSCSQLLQGADMLFRW